MNFITFDELLPGIKNWAATVQVIDKQKPQISKKGRRYLKLLLADDKANKIDALIYGSDIDFFRNHFQIYRRFVVSNARLQYADDDFTVERKTCTMIIDNSTVVEPLDEQQPPLYQFTPFKKLCHQIDTNSDLDMIGIVIHVNPQSTKGTTPIRDIVIADQSSMAIILTLWGEHATDEGQIIAETIHTQPLVAALRVKATSYALTLSTKFASCILINPPIQEGPPLRQWAAENNEAIVKAITEKTYESPLELLPPPNAEDITHIGAIVTAPQKKAFWIRGTAKLLDRSQKLWYHACPFCHKSIRSTPEYKITCLSCQRRIHVIARPRITVDFADWSGNITLDLYGKDAQQLLPYKISEIQQQESENNIPYRAIEECISENTIICFIKKAPYSFKPSATQKYTAIVAHKIRLADRGNKLTGAAGTSNAQKYTEGTNAEDEQEPMEIVNEQDTATPSVTPNNRAQGSTKAKVDDWFLTSLKITESPPKKQRTAKSDDEEQSQ
nr:replication protein A 70 kDa DNA-binding subunit D-like [Coffea arabica]